MTPDEHTPAHPMPRQVNEPNPLKGTCRICGCTDEHPCAIVTTMFEDAEGLTVVTCAWLDDTETLCTNARCLEASGLGTLIEQLVEAEAPTGRIILP